MKSSHLIRISTVGMVLAIAACSGEPKAAADSTAAAAGAMMDSAGKAAVAATDSVKAAAGAMVDSAKGAAMAGLDSAKMKAGAMVDSAKGAAMAGVDKAKGTIADKGAEAKKEIKKP